MTASDFDRDAARADLCRLLAACYYEPGPEFTDEKIFESMLAAALRIHPELAEQVRRLGQAYSSAELQDLLVDYTRLFLGPVQALARPYGSAWQTTEQSVMQDVTMSVLALYAEGGFEMDESFRDLPDHIAAELEFLYLLNFREVQARHVDEVAKLTATADLRKRLLDEHLGRWVGPFATAVSAGAQSDFYRELAALTDHFVRLEARAVSAA